MLHQLWSDGSFFPIINQSAMAIKEPGATLVWSVEADSWNEAMARYHEWREWEAYCPMEGDDIVYSIEQETMGKEDI